MGKPPCGAEPRIELGPALQQADALPTEQRRTIEFWTSILQAEQLSVFHKEFFNFSHEIISLKVYNMIKYGTESAYTLYMSNPIPRILRISQSRFRLVSV